MITPTIVTVDELREHLRLPTILEGSPGTSPDEADLQRKLDAATELVCDYLVADQGSPADEVWIEEIEGWTVGSPSAPALVIMAVLEQAAELYRFRGDDDNSSDRKRNRDEITPAIGNLLTKYHRPSFA